MIKRILALILVGVLLTILIVNVVNDKQTREDAAMREQEYAIRPSDNTTAQVVPSGGVLKEGQAAPDLQTTTLSGDIVSLNDYRGKKIILNFWTTWCAPCREEMPDMQDYYEEGAETDNVEILAVNLTKMDNGIDKVEAFVKDYGLTFPILMDESGSLGDQFQAISIPTTYILDEEGIITKKIMGPMDQEMIAEMMQE